MSLRDGVSISPAHALKCELAGEVLRSSGMLRLQVTGWSMLPTIWPNDTVVVERVEPGSVSAGDIVLFSRDRRLFAHRVVAKASDARPDQFITQGDGMARPDPPVTGADVLGRVAFIVRDGRCIEPDKRLGLPKRAVVVANGDSHPGDNVDGPGTLNGSGTTATATSDPQGKASITLGATDHVLVTTTRSKRVSIPTSTAAQRPVLGAPFTLRGNEPILRFRKCIAQAAT